MMTRLRDWIIQSYRYVGVAILSILLLVILGYFILLSFFLVNNSWGIPVIISPTSDKVLTYTAKYLQAQKEYQAIQTKIKETLFTIENNTKQIVNNEMVKLEYEKLLDTKFVTINNATIEEEYKNKLLLKTEYTNYRIAMQQKEMNTLQVKMTFLNLENENRSLNYLLASSKEELSQLESKISEHEAILKNITKSPYLQAKDQQVILSFVPYTNMENVKKNDLVYMCNLLIVFCKKAGYVVVIHDEEYTVPHPFFPREVRGKLVELSIKDIEMGFKDLTHFNRKPLFL